MRRPHAPALLIALPALLGCGLGAAADDAPKPQGPPPTIIGIPGLSQQLPDELESSCDEVHVAMCTRPCKTWASSQPDFQYSYHACVANCPKPVWHCR